MSAEHDQPSYHELVRRTRIGSAYTTGDGQEVPQHILTAFDCGCGYRASVFMASEGRALEIFERHLGTAASWHCDDCNTDNKWHEAFCRGCGAGEPDYWVKDDSNEDIVA